MAQARFLIIVQANNGLVYPGVTGDIDCRLVELRQEFPYRLRLHSAIEYPNAIAAIRSLGKLLAALGDFQIDERWYEVSIETVEYLLEKGER